MSQEQVVHVGDTVHYNHASGDITVGTIENITESGFGVMLTLRLVSGHLVVVGAEDARFCLAESINGVTVGADGTVATSKPAAKPDVPVFGYAVSSGNEWLTITNVWTTDHQFAHIFRGDEWTAPERERADLGAALLERPNKSWVPLVEDDGRVKRPIFGYVVERSSSLKYWTGRYPGYPLQEWSVNPLMAGIYCRERAHEIRRRFADDARVLGLVEGAGQCL